MKLKIEKLILVAALLIAWTKISGQTATLTGRILSEGKPVDYAVVVLPGTVHGAYTDSAGFYSIKNIPAGTYPVQASGLGFTKQEKKITLRAGEKAALDFDMTDYQAAAEEIVVTGTLKEVSRMESPVPVEVYNPTFFKKNPTANIFEALQNVNGVRPQINCNVCNTGDIHINGLEGPYTMVLIDGMPIVSSLSTVYGLSGIPNSLVERIEIVKGPASSLYGSEAVGGLINIITKKPQNAPLVSVDLFGTTWQEWNADIGFKMNPGKKVTALTGINYFNYHHIVDNNRDNFTDVTLQNRISVFQKWNFNRKKERLFSLAGRYFYEDRWGGDTRWEKMFRGGDSIYGESIYTKRWEFLGNYQLPTREKLLLSVSYNDHDQNSVYGITKYIASQKIGFGQLTWDKKAGSHDMLAGIALRYTFYDDNTPATADRDNIETQPQQTWLPGVFFQDEISLAEKHKLLLGFRYDYNSVHGDIYTPRFAYKWTIDPANIIRLNAGTGYRVVNLFTEDHAALTGGREVLIRHELDPERSYNINLNYIRKMVVKSSTLIGLDMSAFYTHFANRILGNYNINPNQIVYDNLNGYAVSTGVSANLDIVFGSGLKVLAGGTFMDVTISESRIRTRQILTERFAGTWSVTYKIKKLDLAIDYTGNLYSPMRLPLLGPLDPRRPYSPWWSIQNIQFTYSRFKQMEIYAGIKNLLNWTPNKGNPFIIARANDPFDKNVKYDPAGQVIATPDNPYALTFDPGYVYGPNQGIRGFAGVRWNLR